MGTTQQRYTVGAAAVRRQPTRPSAYFILEAFRDDEPEHCEGASGPDVAFTFVAPARGRYVVTTKGGPTYDVNEPLVNGGNLNIEENLSPTLSALHGACGSELLACAGSATTEAGTLTRLAVPLEEGEAVTLVAQMDDSWLEALDPEHVDDPKPRYVASIAVAPAKCAEVDLGSAADVQHPEPIYGASAPVGPKRSS